MVIAQELRTGENNTMLIKPNFSWCISDFNWYHLHGFLGLSVSHDHMLIKKGSMVWHLIQKEIIQDWMFFSQITDVITFLN